MLFDKQSSENSLKQQEYLDSLIASIIKEYWLAKDYGEVVLRMHALCVHGTYVNCISC